MNANKEKTRTIELKQIIIESVRFKEQEEQKNIWEQEEVKNKEKYFKEFCRTKIIFIVFYLFL